MAGHVAGGRAEKSAPPAAPPSPAAGFAAASDAISVPSSLPAGDTAARAAAPSMVIRTGSARIEVDSLAPAVARVRGLAAQLGGWVASSSISSGRDELHEATLELKVPAARWDDALAGLSPIGHVENVTSQSQDVGEEYVDVSARLDNARRLEQRLLQLLATRTGKLSDVLAVERELASVRGEIERYEGHLRYLRTQVAMSTLSVTVHEPPPLLARTPGTSVIGHAFLESWRNFVAFMAGFIAALGWLIPTAVLVLLLWLGLRWLQRRFVLPRRSAPASGSGA